MSAYVVIEITPSDLQKFEEYEAGAGPIAARFGGELIARDSAPTPIERDSAPSIGVILRFPDKEAVAGYFGAADYAPWRELRHANAETSALAISDQ